MKIQENLVFMRSWCQGVVNSIPKNIDYRFDFEYIIPNILSNERGYEIRSVISITFFHHQGDGVIKEIFENVRTSFYNGTGDIKWDWVRDVKNDHLIDDIGGRHIITAWDRWDYLGGKLEEERVNLRQRRNKFIEACVLWRELTDFKVEGLVKNKKIIQKKFNRIIRLLEEVNEKTLNADFDVFKINVHKYLGAPVELKKIWM